MYAGEKSKIDSGKKPRSHLCGLIWYEWRCCNRLDAFIYQKKERKEKRQDIIAAGHARKQTVPLFGKGVGNLYRVDVMDDAK